jgi:hypothetical protein
VKLTKKFIDAQSFNGKAQHIIWNGEVPGFGVRIYPYMIRVILRAVMFAEFMVESFYSRARRGNRRIAGYVTVSATPLSDKMADQKTANVTARSIYLGTCMK